MRSRSAYPVSEDLPIYPSMTDAAVTPLASTDTRPLGVNLVRVARPAQWAKSAFVLIGPFYGLRDMPDGTPWRNIIVPALLAAAAFAIISSGGYVINDILDRAADRAHPRKAKRPIASGAISIPNACVFAGVLFLIGLGLSMILPSPARWLVVLTIFLYIGNTLLYSTYLKHKVIADVMSLSLGFVLRVFAGCAAVGIEPSIWLLNVTLFLSMFLAFGKRLGERRVLGAVAEGNPALSQVHRPVHGKYNDILLQMAVIATAVMTLMTYSLYVREQESPSFILNLLLWVSLLPATYGLLRCVVRLELGQFDDPTELALHDRGFQAAALAFAGVTITHLWMVIHTVGTHLP